MTTYLIANNADVNTTNAKGITQLVFSAQYNQLANVKLLLDHNADTTIKDALGKTALDYTKDKRFTEITAPLN